MHHWQGEHPWLLELDSGSVFTIMIGEVNVGKRQGWLSWAKRHWGWSPYKEVNIQRNHVACNIFFAGVFFMAILPIFYELGLCCFSPLVQTRHGHAQSAISWKENTFEVAFRQWKVPAPSHGSKLKRDHFGFCALILEVYLWKKQWWISWAKSQWSWCEFTDLMIHLNQESPKTLIVVFVKCLFYSSYMNYFCVVFPYMERKEFCQIRFLLKGDLVWSVFHGMETLYRTSVQKERGNTWVYLPQPVGVFWWGGGRELLSRA